jgi:SAM-dependent methyltransferase
MHNDLARVRRVLDVGCGPATNTAWFKDCNYLGVDINAAYIESARRRFARDFLVADVTQYEFPDQDGFDFVLANSLLHHIDDAGVHKLLSRLATLLGNDGHVHIIDLVLPLHRGMPRMLARLDRGCYPRTLESWKGVFAQHFDFVVFEPFPLRLAGVAFWDLVYFKGKRKA